MTWKTLDNPKTILEVNEPFTLKLGKRTFVRCVPDHLGIRVSLIDLVRAVKNLPKDQMNEILIDKDYSIAGGEIIQNVRLQQKHSNLV